MPSYQRLDILAFLDRDTESGGDKTAVAAQGPSEGESGGDFDKI